MAWRRIFGVFIVVGLLGSGDPVLIVAAVVFVLWFVLDLVFRPRPRLLGDADGGVVGVASRLRAVAQPKGHYVPPAPRGTPVGPWGRVRSCEIAGESFYGDNIARLFQGVREFSEPGGATLHLPAQLVHAMDNPYDHNAIAVWMGGQHVGYLSRDLAAVHVVFVRRLAERGEVMTVEGRIWARHDASRVYARATIQLPVPGAYRPVNELPEVPHVVLPVGSTMKVTKTEENMEILTTLAVSGERVPVAVTLRPIMDIRPRSAVEAIEVSVYDEPVGILSPTSTANLKPLVDRVVSLGLVPVAQAEVRGNELMAEMTIHVAKAAEVDPGWLASLRSASPEPVEPAGPVSDEDGWDDE